jgi:hypothetical protein
VPKLLPLPKNKTRVWETCIFCVNSDQMTGLLLCLGYATASLESYDLLFNNPEGLPSLVELWSPWCQHCAKFAAGWTNLTQLPKYQGKVFFTDINCYLTQKICRQFPGDATPRIYWFDVGNPTPRQYIGPFSVSTIEEFVDRQLNSPLMNWTNSEDTSFDKPLFLFNISAADPKSLTIAERTAAINRHFDVLFFHFADANGHLPTLLGSSNRGQNASFSGNWSVDALSRFVEVHSLPFLTYYTSLVDHFVHSSFFSIFVFILPVGTRRDSVFEPALTLNEFGLTSWTSCDIDSYVCRYTGSKPGGDGVLVFWNRSSGFFFKYQGQFTVDGVKQWWSDVEAGRSERLGPGNSSFWLMFYEVRANGGFHYYILAVPVILCVALVVGPIVVLCMPAPKAHAT